MRMCVLFSALISLAQMPALAQETLSTSGQSLQGTWISGASLPDGTASTFEIGTYSADGSYIGANVDASHTAHVGVWLRIGDRKFAFTVQFFTRDDKGVLNGIVRARLILTLAEDLQSYEAQGERVIMDTSGRELQVISGLRGRASRVKVELPKSVPAQ